MALPSNFEEERELILELYLAITISSPGHALELDSSLIRPWNQTAQLPCKPPFRATFKKNGKEFSFLAVDHLEGAVSASAPELEIIREQIQRFSPNRLLIEFDSNGNVLPKDVIEKALANPCFKDSKFICGESIYAAWIASRMSPPASVLGAEPTPQNLDAALKGKVSDEDLKLYNAVMVMISMRRDSIPQSEWPKVFAERNRGLSFQEAQDLLKQKIGKSAFEVQPHWIEPRSGAGATPIQRTAAQVDGAREPEIVKKVEESIRSNARTMMVYGSSHYFKQTPALEKAFGSPAIECFDTKAAPPNKSRDRKAQPGVR